MNIDIKNFTYIYTRTHTHTHTRSIRICTVKLITFANIKRSHISMLINLTLDVVSSINQNKM